MLLPGNFLENFAEDLAAVLGATHVNTTQMMYLHEKMCSFLRDYSDVAPNEANVFAKCAYYYIQCISKYVESPGRDVCAVKDFCKIIGDIPKLHCVKYKYLQEVLKNILDKIVDLRVALWFAKELVTNFKLGLQYFNKEFLSKLIAACGSFLTRVADTLDICGDYSYQFVMLETVFYMCSSQQINKFSSMLFSGSETLQNAFRNINRDNFNVAVREFLNLVNCRNNNVSSVNCKRAAIDGLYITALKGGEGNELWVDFNSGSNTISILCTGNSLETLPSRGENSRINSPASVIINAVDVQTVTASRWLQPEFSTWRCSIVSFNLKETCPVVFRPSSQALRPKQLKLEILSGSALERLEENVLPKMFQGKFEILSLPFADVNPQKPRSSVAVYNSDSLTLGTEPFTLHDTMLDSTVHLEFTHRAKPNHSTVGSYLLYVDEPVHDISNDKDDICSVASTHLTGCIIDHIDLTLDDEGTESFTSPSPVYRTQNNHVLGAVCSEQYYSIPECNTATAVIDLTNETEEPAQSKSEEGSHYFTAGDTNFTSNMYTARSECLEPVFVQNTYKEVKKVPVSVEKPCNEVPKQLPRKENSKKKTARSKTSLGNSESCKTTKPPVKDFGKQVSEYRNGEQDQKDILAKLPERIREKLSVPLKYTKLDPRTSQESRVHVGSTEELSQNLRRKRKIAVIKKKRPLKASLENCVQIDLPQADKQMLPRPKRTSKTELPTTVNQEIRIHVSSSELINEQLSQWSRDPKMMSEIECATKTSQENRIRVSLSEESSEKLTRLKEVLKNRPGTKASPENNSVVEKQTSGALVEEVEDRAFGVSKNPEKEEVVQEGILQMKERQSESSHAKYTQHKISENFTLMTKSSLAKMRHKVVRKIENCSGDKNSIHSLKVSEEFLGEENTTDLFVPLTNLEEQISRHEDDQNGKWLEKLKDPAVTNDQYHHQENCLKLSQPLPYMDAEILNKDGKNDFLLASKEKEILRSVMDDHSYVPLTIVEEETLKNVGDQRKHLKKRGKSAEPAVNVEETSNKGKRDESDYPQELVQKTMPIVLLEPLPNLQEILRNKDKQDKHLKTEQNISKKSLNLRNPRVKRYRENAQQATKNDLSVMEKVTPSSDRKMKKRWKKVLQVEEDDSDNQEEGVKPREENFQQKQNEDKHLRELEVVNNHLFNVQKFNQEEIVDSLLEPLPTAEKEPSVADHQMQTFGEKCTVVSGSTKIDEKHSSSKKSNLQDSLEKRSADLKWQIISEILSNTKNSSRIVPVVRVQRLNIFKNSQTDMCQVDNSQKSLSGFASKGDKFDLKKNLTKCLEKPDVDQTVAEIDNLIMTENNVSCVATEKFDTKAQGQPNVNILNSQKQFKVEPNQCNIKELNVEESKESLVVSTLFEDNPVLPLKKYDVKTERAISQSKRNRTDVPGKENAKPAKQQKRLNSRKLYNPNDLSYTKLFTDNDFDEKTSVYFKSALECPKDSERMKEDQKQIAVKKAKTVNPESGEVKMPKKFNTVRKGNSEVNNVLDAIWPLQEMEKGGPIKAGGALGVQTKEKLEKNVQTSENTFRWKLKKKMQEGEVGMEPNRDEEKDKENVGDEFDEVLTRQKKQRQLKEGSVVYRSILGKKREEEEEEMDAFDKILTSQERARNRKLARSGIESINTTFSTNYTLPQKSCDNFLSVLDSRCDKVIESNATLYSSISKKTRKNTRNKSANKTRNKSVKSCYVDVMRNKELGDGYESLYSDEEPPTKREKTSTSAKKELKRQYTRLIPFNSKTNTIPEQPKLSLEKQNLNDSNYFLELYVEEATEPVKVVPEAGLTDSDSPLKGTPVESPKSAPKIKILSNVVVKEASSNLDKKCESSSVSKERSVVTAMDVHKRGTSIETKPSCSKPNEVQHFSQTSTVIIPPEVFNMLNVENQNSRRSSDKARRKTKLPSGRLPVIEELITSPHNVKVSTPSAVGTEDECSQSITHEEILNWVSTGLSEEAAPDCKRLLEGMLPSHRNMIRVWLDALRGPVPAGLINLYELLLQLDNAFNSYFHQD